MPEMPQHSDVLTPPPTASVSMEGNVIAIIIAATVSSSVFIVAILVLLLLLYHRDPLCCQFLCSCRFFQSPSQYANQLCSLGSHRDEEGEDLSLQSQEPVGSQRLEGNLHPTLQQGSPQWGKDCPPPYFSSNQRLVGPQAGAQQTESAAENPGVQGDELFCVGPPSSYQLPPWEQLRLPSYESVRKKDRQREIHQMIAERFGLWADPTQELPPPYEQALRHPPACPGAGTGSDFPDGYRLLDTFQASASYPTQRNTAV